VAGVKGESKMSKLTCRLLLIVVVAYCAVLTGCSANVGVGLSVGVPVGNHGYVSVGTGGWF
jgi:hypothetical protein